MKIGIISQARMTSTRLPGKVLIKIKDKQILKYHIDRLKWSELPIFIATTINQEDNPIVDFSNKEELKVFRGDEHNVLSRFYQCATENNLDVIVRVTSDCPLIDGQLIKDAVEVYLKENDEKLYLSNTIERTFPRGLDFEIFSYKLLDEAFRKADQDSELEHVTPYINQNKSSNVRVKSFLKATNDSHYRITLDTKDDFKLIERLIIDFNADDLTGEEIVKVLKSHPDLVLINAHIEQKKG